MERNSEQTVVKAMGIAALVVVAIGGAVSALSDAGIEQQLPWFGTVATIFGLLSKIAWEYVKARPGKHFAMAEKLRAEASLLAAKKDPPAPAG